MGITLGASRDIFALLFLVALAQGCSREPAQQPKFVPVPQIGTAVTLRVVHAVNPRLPHFTKDQLNSLLRRAAAVAQASFGVRITFVDAGEITIDKLFDLMPARWWSVAEQRRFDYRSGRGDPKELADSFAAYLKLSKVGAAEAQQFAGPESGIFVGKNEDELGRLLARIELDGLAKWQKVLAADGRPVIDNNPYNDLAYWDKLGYGGLPFDVVVTNQLAASAEYFEAPVHSVLRGGMTLGLTAYNKGSPLGAYSVVSTFAVLSDDPWLLELRGNERYTETEEPRLIAYVLAHELGHLLFHYDHPWGKTACVMNPTYLLRLRAWVKKLSPKDCAPGSSPAMTRGAVKIPYEE